MKIRSLIKNIFTYAIAVSVVTIGSVTTASAESTLDIVKKRGHLRCQIGKPSPGFYNLDAKGKWEGFYVANCQAIAAAIFGDKSKVEYQSVGSQVRFTALANGESDLLSQSATMTMSRDTQLGLDFLQPNFYDGQGFMVRKDSGITSALQLKGAKVCVKTGSTSELNLADFNRKHNLKISAVTFEDFNVRDETYVKGGCDALTNDKSSLAGNSAAFPKPKDHMILPETLSKEPLGLAVRQGDSDWADLIRWALNAMVNAEELGVTSKNVDEMRKSDNPSIRRLLGVEGNVHEGIGLDKNWAYNIIKQVGNYGENYERYLGNGEKALGITRKGTLNALWSNGGLMYSPPMR